MLLLQPCFDDTSSTTCQSIETAITRTLWHSLSLYHYVSVHFNARNPLPAKIDIEQIQESLKHNEGYCVGAISSSMTTISLPKKNHYRTLMPSFDAHQAATNSSFWHRKTHYNERTARSLMISLHQVQSLGSASIVSLSRNQRNESDIKQLQHRLRVYFTVSYVKKYNL